MKDLNQTSLHEEGIVNYKWPFPSIVPEVIVLETPKFKGYVIEYGFLSSSSGILDYVREGQTVKSESNY